MSLDGPTHGGSWGHIVFLLGVPVRSKFVVRVDQTWVAGMNFSPGYQGLQILPLGGEGVPSELDGLRGGFQGESVLFEASFLRQCARFEDGTEVVRAFDDHLELVLQATIVVDFHQEVTAELVRVGAGSVSTVEGGVGSIGHQLIGLHL